MLFPKGMVVSETYFRRQENGTLEYFNVDEVVVEKDSKGKIIGAKLIKDGQKVEVGGMQKMSKSKNNGVDPQSMITNMELMLVGFLCYLRLLRRRVWSGLMQELKEQLGF